MQLNDTFPSLETAQDLGLTKEEFERIKEIMGRVPNFTELHLFSVMWSENCSFKNAVRWLKTLPQEGGRLLNGNDQKNTGLIKIGDGLACAFKMESHNHSSVLTSYQRAATGISRVHREIISMGARPIATLNSLRFGNIEAKYTKAVIPQVASGIGDYGNSLGIPTVGGEVYFDECYHQRYLINILSLGVVNLEEIVSAHTDGPGNPVFILGSATGKEGIQRVTSAASDLAKNTLEDLQIGDPFQEKLLLEAILETVKTTAIIGMQNIGSAGIASAAATMSANSGMGIRIDLDQVPTRQLQMEAFEILLSESQERMLVVADKSKEHLLLEVCEKWDLSCHQIGEVNDSGRLTFFRHGEQMADLPGQALVRGEMTPVYERSFQRPTYFKKISEFRSAKIKKPTDYAQTAWKVFSSPNIVSKRWIYEQYDSMVQTNSMSTNQPTDAALIRIKGTRRALVMTTGCNSAYVYADPYIGAMIAVSEAARNIVCSGGEPIAISICLNFGNPYDPEVYWQFVHAIKGIGEACRKLGTPVSGSDVSFYNHSADKENTDPIYPTPTIGMIGLLNDYEQSISLYFKQEGHQIYMIGTPHNDLGSSEYLRVVHGIAHSPAPVFDLDEECHIQRNLKKIITSGLIQSAHDISEGGLFVCLMECAMFNKLGFDMETDTNFRKDAYLFGESQSRIVVTTAEENEDELVNYLNSNNVPFTKLGEVIGKNVIIDDNNFGAISKWKGFYDSSIEDSLEH